MRKFSAQPDRIFPVDQGILHPAQVRSFIRVRYDIVKNDYVQNSLNARLSYASAKDKLQSGYQSKEVIFAVCDFFLPHQARHEWSFGALAELWSQECFQCIRSRPDYLVERAESLVPLNRIAGKFVPGQFTAEEFPSFEQPLIHRGVDLKGNWTTPMVVMRMPGRICLDPSNYSS